MNEDNIKVFSGSASLDFTKKVCEYLNISMNKGTAIQFSEGNTYVKVEDQVRGRDVYIIQTIGLDPNNEFMELLFWIDAFKRSGARSIIAIMPFFSYAQADKKDEPGVSIRARVCADCLESAGVSRVVTMDLHSAQIQGFFKKPVDHLYASSMFYEHIKKEFKNEDYVIVSPDEGFAKKARFYSTMLKVPLAIGNKMRRDHSEKAEILNVMGDVEGKTSIIIDDFTISCGTLAEIARTLEKNGSKRIVAYVSHGLLNEDAIKKLEDSPIEKLYMTDSVYNPLNEKSDKIEIISAAKMFADSIRIMESKGSLSELFLEY